LISHQTLYINKPKSNLVVSTGFAILTPKKIPPSYLYILVTTDQFVDYLTFNADGSAYPAVLPQRFGEAEIILPPQELLDAFERIVGPMLELIASNEEQSRTLAALRDTLLPKLMRGEVRVSEL
jgi:type I restriction enzyme S subunit